MNPLETPNIRKLLFTLQHTNSTTEAMASYILLGGKDLGLLTVLSVEGYSPDFNIELFPRILKIHNVIPYYSSHKLLVLSQNTAEKALSQQKAIITIDHTLMFDTNTASYVGKLLKGQSLGDNQTEIVKFFDELIYQNCNFDHLYYLQENTKQIHLAVKNSKEGKLAFWKSLNKKFRWNLASLMYLRKINNTAYIKQSKIQFDITFRTAIQEAITASFDYYASKEGQQKNQNTLQVQKAILLLLLVSLRINFSSKRSARNKAKELLSEIQHNIGAFFDREITIMLMYFISNKQIPILKSINKGKKTKRLLKKIDNIAWDLYAPRFMEQVITASAPEKVMIPFIASFDKNLQETTKLFPIKGSIIDPKSGRFLSFTSNKQKEIFSTLEIESEVSQLFTMANIEERSRNRPKSLQDLNVKIKLEYRKLRNSLYR